MSAAEGEIETLARDRPVGSGREGAAGTGAPGGEGPGAGGPGGEGPEAGGEGAGAGGEGAGAEGPGAGGEGAGAEGPGAGGEGAGAEGPGAGGEGAGAEGPGAGALGGEGPGNGRLGPAGEGLGRTRLETGELGRGGLGAWAEGSGPGLGREGGGEGWSSALGDGADVQRIEELWRRLLCRCEPALIYLQSLLVWERPLHSGLMLLGLSGLFWLFSSTSLRPVFLISLSVLATVFLDNWKTELLTHVAVHRLVDEGESDGNSIRPRLLRLPDLCRYLAESCVAFNVYLKEVLEYKKQNPGKFCLKMCLGCSALAAIGHYIPGIMISYIFRKPTVKLESCDEPMAETESESEAELSCFNSKVDVRTTALALAITDSELSDEEASILESGGFSMSRGATPQLTDVSEDLDQQSLHSEPEEAFAKDLPEFPSVEDLSGDVNPSQISTELSPETCSTRDPQSFIQTLSSPLHFVNTHFNGNGATMNTPQTGQASVLNLSLEAFSEEIVTSAITTVVQNTLCALLSNPLTGNQSESSEFLSTESQQALSRAGSMELDLREVESHDEVDDFEVLDQGELDHMDTELGLNEQLQQVHKGHSTSQVTEAELLRES
ncbi:reticulophagy regulator 2 isoform X2 [Stegostoma tigrinum]|uniref:reticulophagy regulator 2 isoform X2 n=1 Tax=Stegostoma tigrinum TaxID=3053191 RepID=UPI0028704DDA|nr:reticulophagy regulator 2 isoform X2 [Stegostoma tigrinum]